MLDKACVQPFHLVEILHVQSHSDRIHQQYLIQHYRIQHYRFVHKMCTHLVTLGHDNPHNDHLWHPQRAQKPHHGQS